MKLVSLSPVVLTWHIFSVNFLLLVIQMIHYIDKEYHRLGTMLQLVEESGAPAIKLVVCTHKESDATKVYHVSTVR